MSRSVPEPSSSLAPYTAKVMPTRRKIISASSRRERITSPGVSSRAIGRSACNAVESQLQRREAARTSRQICAWNDQSP
ncbi:hypothetical protein DdX_22009 [Ditylenchus destructor]|uniref:Uncharacterized protein n=1 Tax=Ditylenchus destructor TaxID=166010 RepID=A0AAD4QUS1_9BILA|nr:hypothetical protein DdX_22009 [Ditylenchus destructor]